jgi:mRNA interferase RelE/StbE
MQRETSKRGRESGGKMSEGTFEVVLSPEAQRVYARQDRVTRQRIALAIDHLKGNPTSGTNISRLHGEFEGNYRIRMGPWRIVYSVNLNSRRVWVKLIRSRGDAYKR